MPSRFPLESHDNVSPTHLDPPCLFSAYASIDRFLPDPNVFSILTTLFLIINIPTGTRAYLALRSFLFDDVSQLYTSPFSHRRAITTNDHTSRLTRNYDFESDTT
ncbi:uncharacterized protein LY89DRAFT_427335 [Mollisia scopiformis]|uniref:Uncharacterized protein n=1 Tax=Mollisia scopiformis TaxID=149040 RepID=A0A194XLR7_MOLSC|nr:uncharacterized protein LY89DRAFT_427335 [Mollisia scopiformis]KUJ21123.1 hypothetical protein LY89DRAFT_427335 [Mollisia scopiformis]